MITTLEAKLSLRLVDGRMESKLVTCTADEYQFRCGDEFRLRRRDAASALLLTRLRGGDDGEAAAIALNGLQLRADDTVFRLDA